jgi:hypothetical protein
MRRRSAVLAAASALLLLAGPSLAAQDNGYPVVPVEYDPGSLGTITAQWETHVGLPDAGSSDHALHLGKDGELTDDAAAFAVVQKVEGTVIPDTVSFWIPADGDDSYCNNGSPRWNIYTEQEGGLYPHFLGCAFGEETGEATDRRGREWVQLTWSTRTAPQALPPIPTGFTALAVQLVQDEPGSTLIDDIEYNGKTMGKPGNGEDTPQA